MSIVDYDCPKCGYDGPHPYLTRTEADDASVVECGYSACGIEFVIPDDPGV